MMSKRIAAKMDRNASVLPIAQFAVTYTHMLRVARTIADLAGQPTISRIHIAEALGYRRQPPRA